MVYIIHVVFKFRELLNKFKNVMYVKLYILKIFFVHTLVTNSSLKLDDNLKKINITILHLLKPHLPSL